MKAYNVRVNGKDYFVEIEEAITRRTVPVQAPAKDTVPAAVPLVATVPPATSYPSPVAGMSAPAPVPAPPGASVQLVTSPIPGTVLSVNVKVADVVKQGDLLMTIEAMKMENEILAVGDGIVTQINATKGTNVNTGDVLLVM